jgi:hypothetical protein
LPRRTSRRWTVAFFGKETVFFFETFPTAAARRGIIEVIVGSITGRTGCKALTFFEAVAFDYLTTSSLAIEPFGVPALGLMTPTPTIITTVVGHFAAILCSVYDKAAV